MRKANTLLGLAFLVALAVTAASSASFAQAGSAGGTVGKQDKSLSGGDETPPPRRDTRPAKPAPATSSSPRETRCMAIVGTWTWYLGITETVFNQNGSMRNSNGVTGTWACPRAPGSATWSNGPPVTETYTMSQDRNSLAVVSAWGGGVKFTATRRSQN